MLPDPLIYILALSVWSLIGLGFYHFLRFPLYFVVLACGIFFIDTIAILYRNGILQ